MYHSIFIIFSFLISHTLAAPSPFISDLEPCAQLQGKKEPVPGSLFYEFSVPVDVAMKCLYSAPFKSGPALDLMNSLRPMIEFQSTLDYLKDPQAMQPNYLYPPVDIPGALDDIEKRIYADHYTSEAMFEKELSDLFIATRDGHFSWRPQLFDLFGFTRNVRLVSISKDGTSIPDIFVHEDIVAKERKFFPSSVTEINGVEASEFLKHDSATDSAFQDRDAHYENQFFGWTPERYNGGSFQNPNAFEVEPELSLTFANGSTRIYHVKAILPSKFDGILDGEQLYQKFVRPARLDFRSSLLLGNDKNTSGLASLFPAAIVRGANSQISGHLPETKGLEDVAVLSVRGFPYSRSFCSTITKSLALFRQSGRKKLLIDMSGNPGGLLAAGQDLFGQLFPEITQYLGVSMRAHEALYQIGKWANSFPADTLKNGGDFGNFAGLLLNFRADRAYKPDGTGLYPTWNSVYGPINRNGSLLTETLIKDLEIDTMRDLRGFQNGTLPNLKRPFASEDIIVISDGSCSSMCALFVSMLKNQAGVRSLVIGGTPAVGPMQTAGGVKGGVTWSFVQLSWTLGLMAKVLQEVLETAHKIDFSSSDSFSTVFPPWFRSEYNGTAIGSLVDTFGYVLSRTSLHRRAFAGVNLVNIIRRHDSEAIPVQFLYEAADCRIFTTEAMVHNVTNVWAAAADAMFGNGKCVEGSERHPSSLTGGNGGYAVFEDAPVPKHNFSELPVQRKPLRPPQWW